MAVVNPNVTVPEIFSKEDLLQYIQPLYVIEKYWVDRKTYRVFRERMRNIMRGAIRKKETRDYPISFKFYKDDEKTYTLPLRMFLINVYLWFPLCEVYGIHCVDESFIIEPEQLPKVNAFVYQKIVKTLEHYNVGPIVNYCIAELTDTLSSISLDFSEIMGLHFDEETYQKMYDNPEIRALMDLKFEPTDQPVDIERKLNDAEKRLVELLKADPTNPIGIFLRVGTGIKTKQLVEMCIAAGLRPTLTGNVVTLPIENSMMVGGLDRPSYMYIDALGARKPLIANNKEMGNVGYFGKTLDLLSGTVHVSKKIVNCGSKYLIPYQVKTRKHLRRLRGKYYLDELTGDLKLIDIKDESLIGTTVKCRSAATCCCGENEVCAVCVGDTINRNWDIASGFAIYLTEEYSKQLEQNVLSTKHLLTTKSEQIVFSEEFYKFFRVDGEEIKFLNNVKDIKDLVIYIDPEDIKRVDEYDADSGYNTYIDSGKFQILNPKTEEAIDIQLKNSKPMYIRAEALEIMKSNKGLIPFKRLEEDTSLFEVSIENNELVKPFYDLIALLDRKDRKELDEVTIETMSQRFLDILVEANVDVPIVSGEFMINRLCREKDDVRWRPDFSRKKKPEYEVYAASQVIEHNPSITLGLSFEHLMRQLTNLDVDERTEPSYMDPFFKEEVPMDPFMQHRLPKKQTEEV